MYKHVLLVFVGILKAYPADTDYSKLDARLVRVSEISSKFGLLSVKAPRTDSEVTYSSLKKAVKLGERFLASFGISLKTSPVEIIIFEKDVSHIKFPEYIKKNCHPGWMIPEKIFIVRSRVERCVEGENFEIKLARVLLHELGHVVLWRMNRQIFGDLELNEGFATWFENQALDELPRVNEEICDIRQAQDQGRFSWYIRGSFYYYGFPAREVFNLIQNGDVNKLKSRFKAGRNKVCDNG
ncbi:MAG: hypothetical protein N2654_00165 [Deltaproteobacteria bacterium]|nr:hypothetical protein [Deltaproteobacteria bacterium]